MIFAAAAVGYVAFATFLVNQAIFLTILGSILYLIDVIIHDGTQPLLDPDAAIGARLRAMVGLRPNVLGQLVVIVQGVARVAIVVIAVGRRARALGRPVAGLVQLAARRLFRLRGRRRHAVAVVDAGGRRRIRASPSSSRGSSRAGSANACCRRPASTPAQATRSARSSAISARPSRCCSAAAQVGLDVQKLAIIAGALSVGIGFGLQSIANNFVSGLILLWERGIRVGDWVMVGTDQGFVRRINARATEIETFDRATLIVPNSNLVSGVVKNWVNPDRVGRILIAINVDYDSDVEQVREILIDAARAQDLVLKIPAPSVQFADFGDWAFKFNLVCFVDDVETAGRTQSELNFDILRRLRERTIRMPNPQFAPMRPTAS